MNYFAYGSNMLTERLIERIGSVRLESYRDRHTGAKARGGDLLF